MKCSTVEQSKYSANDIAAGVSRNLLGAKSRSTPSWTTFV